MSRRFGFSLETRDYDANLNNPSIPISSDSIITLLGTGLTTDSGIHVSEFNALRLSAVWRCVSLISGAVAQLPLRAYVGLRQDDGPRQEGPKDTILNHAPVGYTMYSFKETIMLHLLLWGNCFIRLVRNNAGDTVVDWILLRPWEVTVTRKGPGAPKQFQIMNSGTTLSEDEILHIPGLGYDGIRGLSPIAYMRQTLGLGVAALQYGAGFFGNGAMLGGLLKSNDRIPQDKAEQLKTRWREKFTGLSRAHEVAVLDSGIDYQALSIPPDEAQFLQTQQFNVNDICRWYGVPPHLAGDVDKTTSWGKGLEEQSLGFVRYTVSSWVGRVEESMDAVLPVGQYAGFDMDRLLRADSGARALFYHNAISDGWMSRAEARAREKMAPAPPEAKLDEFLVSTLEVPADPPEPAPDLEASPPPDEGTVTS